MTLAEELSRLEWDPRKHPRGKGGRWARTAGGGGTAISARPPSMATWSQDYVPGGGDGFLPDLTPAKGFKALTSKGRTAPPATGTADDPIDVQGDLNKALHHLHAGRHVRLNQPDEISLLMDRIQEISKRASAKGKHPTWDFGRLTVAGTNLFTAQSRGIPRVKMPQFSGLAQPGTTAARLAGGDGKFVDLAPQFVSKLRREGIKVRRTTVPVSHLRATQTELDGAKVSGFADAARQGNEGARKALAEPIFVTRDHYVIDGHHRWAANMLLDAQDGKLGDVPQNVTMIDMDIGAAIPYALEFANAMGIANRALARAYAILDMAGLAWDPDEVVIDRRAWWDPKLHPRDPEGQFSAKAARLDKVASKVSQDATDEALKGKPHSQHRASALTSAALEIRFAAQEIRERKVEQAKQRLRKAHKRLKALEHGTEGTVAEHLANLGMLAFATAPAARAVAFEERLHPRDPRSGKWIDGPGGGVPIMKGTGELAGRGHALRDSADGIDDSSIVDAVDQAAGAIADGNHAGAAKVLRQVRPRLDEPYLGSPDVYEQDFQISLRNNLADEIDGLLPDLEPGKVAALDPFYNEIPETRGTPRTKGTYGEGGLGQARADDAAIKGWRAGHPVAPEITKAEARDGARPVSSAEFQDLAREGLNQLGTLSAQRDGTAGLDRNWDKIKADSWAEVTKSWGGATIDAATGKALPDGADRYALTVKPQGMDKVSLPQNATRAQFDKAMDLARERYREELEKAQYHLGVFHDDDEGRIDIDPVLVVDSQHEVETIGSYTHAVGGAYHFKSGDGFWPPYVDPNL